MTRINVIPVEELSDQNLIAEYRELPRALKQDINTDDAAAHYHLGPGHMKWARRHWLFTLNRYRAIYNEMKYRGFFPKYNPENIIPYLKDIATKYPEANYNVTKRDIELNRERIIERYEENPYVHTWRLREQPKWLEGV